MTALKDTRASCSEATELKADHPDRHGVRPHLIGHIVTQLLSTYPAANLDTLRITSTPTRDGEVLTAFARIGDLAEPECPSCHTHGDHPHTEYCQLALTQCDNPEPHKAHIRFDDSPHNVCPGRLVPRR